MVRIKWDGKVHEGETFEDVLTKIEKDPWVGSRYEIAKRVEKHYGKPVRFKTAKEFFERLEELGELTIVEREESK